MMYKVYATLEKCEAAATGLHKAYSLACPFHLWPVPNKEGSWFFCLDWSSDHALINFEGHKGVFDAVQ